MTDTTMQGPTAVTPDQVTSAPPSAASLRLASACWLATLAASAALRCAWLDYDLPWAPETDAYKFVDEATRIVQSGQWRPHDLQYPTGYTYLLAVLQWLFGVQTTYAAHLCARVVSAGFGLVTLWGLGRFCRAVAGPACALVATALVGFSTLHITLSRSAAPDAMLTCFWCLSLWIACRPSPSIARLVAAGACAGVAAATKFSALYALAWLPLFAAYLWPAGTSLRTRALAACAAVGASVITLLCIDPWLISMASDYARRFQFELLLQRSGQVGQVQLGWFDYLVSLTPVPGQPWLSSSFWGDLGPAVVLVVGGIGWGLADRSQRFSRLLALHALGFVVAISSPGHIKALRFALPVLPLFAALGAVSALALLRHRLLSAHLRRALGALLVLALVSPALHAVDTIARMSQPSSVARFRAYAAEHLPPGTIAFVEPFGLGDYRPLRWRVAELTDLGSRQYGFAPELGPSPERDPLLHGALPRQLRNSGVQYMILHSYFDDALSATPDNLRWFPRTVEHYERFVAAVEQVAQCVHREPGYSNGRTGPDISVWRMLPRPGP